MREKILQTDVAAYTHADWSGKNTSGTMPFGDNIIVLPDESSDKVGEKGLIHIPDETKGRMTLASESGVIVAAGEDAYRYSPRTGKPYDGRVPKVGDRVLFARYSGRGFRGRDGVRYILMSDNCVGGIEIEGETP